MALKKCRECGEHVSSRAKTCPKCGCPTKRGGGFGNALGGCLIFCLIIGGCTLWMGKRVAEFDFPDPVPWEQADNTAAAIVTIQDFVTTSLKSPTTAEFPGVYELADSMELLPNQRYKFTSYVDAQNTFGAMIRMHYVGIIQQVGPEEWALESLEFEE